MLTRQQFFFTFICLVWGANWAAMKIGVTAVPPGFFSGTRWTLAGLVLLVWRHANGNSIWIPRGQFRRILLVAVLLIPLNAVIMLYGLRYVGTGLASVLSSALTPIGTLGFGILLGQERFTMRQFAGIVLGVAGLVLLFGQKAIDGRFDTTELLGALGIIIGNLFYCFGSVLARPLMTTMSPVLLAGLTNFIGGFILLVLSTFLEPGVGAVITGNWGLPAWGAWLFMVLAGSLGATVLYFFLVRDWGASRTSTYAFICPIIAVMIGLVFLGEHVDLLEVLGMLLMLVAAAVVLGHWKSAPAERPDSNG